MLDMRMTAKQFERESNRAEKEAKKGILIIRNGKGKKVSGQK